MSKPSAVLLDTCAVIWLANRDPISETALEAIIDAGLVNGVFVSPVSAWEVGMLSRPKPGRAAAVQFRPDPKTWFANFLGGPAIMDAPLTYDIAIEASWLPGEFHGDPADRLIVATARNRGFPIVTRDRKIIEYGKNGLVDVIPC